jgi:hypothetical protein
VTADYADDMDGTDNMNRRKSRKRRLKGSSRGAYIARHDKQAWDEQLERDFSPGGKHAKTIQKIDAEIDAGNFTPLT